LAFGSVLTKADDVGYASEMRLLPQTFLLELLPEPSIVPREIYSVVGVEHLVVTSVSGLKKLTQVQDVTLEEPALEVRVDQDASPI
jgi:hypothetical protein